MKPTRIWPLIILIAVFGLTAQTIRAQQPKINSAAASAPIRAALNGPSPTTAGTDCETELQTANQRLSKTLDALEKAETAIKSLQAEIEGRRRLEVVNEDLQKAKDALAAEQAKLIEILRKQTGRKISILFGIIKIRY